MYFISKNKIIISSIIIILITSCKNKDSNLNIIDKFPEVEHLKSIPIKNINFFSKGNVNLISIDSFLVIQRSENDVFQIYNTKNYALLSKFGTIGRGPDEFIFPELLNQTSYDKTNNSPVLSVYDYTRRRFTKINILNAINNQTDRIFTSSSIPKCDNKTLSYFFYKDDDLMIASPEDSRFIIYKNSTQSFETVPYIPITDFSIKKELKPIVYRSASYINKKLGVMASAPILLGEIDFFDLKGNYLSSSIFSSRKNLEKDLATKIMKESNPKYHIVQLQANDKYIYALNYDNYQTDFLSKTNDLLNQSILVFDWKGNPIKKYILDKRRFVRSFAVDWKNNRFYAYCPDEPDYNVIVYNCKNKLKK